MSAAYQFAIDRSRALVLAGCFAAAAVLLFFAGALTGTLYTASRQSSARFLVPESAVKTPKAPSVKPPEIAAEPTGPPPDQSASVTEAPSPTSPCTTTPEETAAAAPAPNPATATSTQPETSIPPSASASAAKPATASSAPPTATAEAKPQSAPTPAPTPATVQTSYAIPLAVRVGSFSIKSNAENLMQSLRDMGYQPAMSRSTDDRGRVWYLVKLGPYKKWNAASKVATRISIAENVTPVIGPMQ